MLDCWASITGWWERNANQTLSVTPKKPFILYFPERPPAIILEGLPAMCLAGLGKLPGEC